MPWKQIDITVTKLISESYLLENGITQADRLSMASSVELRLPLVDYRLVETVIGLMKNNPYMNINPKGWLKEAAKPILPEWVINRPKKGFTPPVLEWEEALFDSYGEYLENGYLVEKNIIRNKTAKILAKGQHPYGTSTPPSFKGLILEIWCRKMQDIVKAAC